MEGEEFAEDNTENPSEESASNTKLTFNEARVLGCLLEKEATTPDNYPLTPNSLHSACNQSSNRNPVTDLGTDEVEEALEGLRYKNLALLVHQSGARVPKAKHTLEDEFPYMKTSQQALICVLLLRGQQTAGELRQRTERMHPFADLDAVEAQLQELIDNKPEPLVRRIPAGGGRRVETFVQLLCTEGLSINEGDSPVSSPITTDQPTTKPATPGRIEELENKVSSLKETVSLMRAELDDVKQQLGI